MQIFLLQNNWQKKASGFSGCTYVANPREWQMFRFLSEMDPIMEIMMGFRYFVICGGTQVSTFSQVAVQMHWGQFVHRLCDLLTGLG